MPGPSDRRSYQSPEAVLAEARRMAAEIRRQAERDAAMLRRDAAEWASSIRREAEARARQDRDQRVATAVAVELVPDETAGDVTDPPTADPPGAIVDLTESDELVDLRAIVPSPPVALEPPPPPPDPVAALEAALRSVLPAPAPAPSAPPADRAPVERAPVDRAPPAERAPVDRDDGARHCAETALDPYEVGRLVALGAWMDAAEFSGPSRPTGVAADRPDRRSGDVIDLGRVVEARRRADERRAEAAEQADRRARDGFRPVESSIESRVHEIVRQAVRRTFSRRSS